VGLRQTDPLPGGTANPVGVAGLGQKGISVAILGRDPDLHDVAAQILLVVLDPGGAHVTEMTIARG